MIPNLTTALALARQSELQQQAARDRLARSVVVTPKIPRQPRWRRRLTVLIGRQYVARPQNVTEC
jgi:hypothetical protein